jgi:hypothetical protein
MMIIAERRIARDIRGAVTRLSVAKHQTIVFDQKTSALLPRILSQLAHRLWVYNADDARVVEFMTLVGVACTLTCMFSTHEFLSS